MLQRERELCVCVLCVCVCVRQRREKRVTGEDGPRLAFQSCTTTHTQIHKRKEGVCVCLCVSACEERKTEKRGGESRERGKQTDGSAVVITFSLSPYRD